MIRAALQKDDVRLKILYTGSIYKELPAIVKWALEVVPERVFIVEEQKEILASVYTMVCGYNNFWSSYLAFKDETAMEHLIDYLMKVRKEEGLRNLYVFCPRELVDVRVYLIAHGFIPECIRKIGGIDHIVETHDGTFNPNYQISTPKEPLPVDLREGKSDDTKALAKILLESLPRDFSTIDDATTCLKRWLTEMLEYTIVAEHNNLPIGVLLLSLETYPVLDENLAMLCFIAVEERFRGTGIGKALVEEACNVLGRKGKHSMEVDVSVHNMPARIFYTRAGFYPFWFSKSYMPHDGGIFYRTDF